MICSQQRLALLLASLVLGASCLPHPVVVVGDQSLGTADPDNLEELRALGTSREHHHEHKYYKGIIIKQLLTLLFSAFINGVTSVIFNWFFPWKVIPPIPGRLGLGQLFGGFLPKHGYPTPPYNGFG